uniref:FkbM family methyltransferase n=1 Tax=Thermodesulfobacterium geofontis TaxID=1295609 RepID=A0A7C4NZN3_9BACT
MEEKRTNYGLSVVQKSEKLGDNIKRLLKIFITNQLWFLKKRLFIFSLIYPLTAPLSLIKNKRRNDSFDYFSIDKKRMLLRYRKIKLVLFYRDLETYKEIFENYVYNHFNLKRSWIVIDCGANIGFYTLRVAPRVKKVISIEPNPYNYEMLLLNLKINRIRNVVPLNLAIYDKRCSIRIYGEGPTSTIFKPKYSEKYVNVRAIPLDDITKRLKSIDLLKIDVEGAEVEVLKGATSTLRKTRNIILEVHTHLIDDKKIWRILERYGFNLQRYSHPDPLISERTYIIIGKKSGDC